MDQLVTEGVVDQDANRWPDDELSFASSPPVGHHPPPMPFSISFAEDFFLDGDIDSIQPSDRPSSVYQAILSVSDETWGRLSRGVFGVDPDHLDALSVLDRVRQTDTCSNLDSPVQVWIDEEGWYDLLVYDSDGESTDVVPEGKAR